tara:strand:- start:123 stop:470 length:348 start_codon:yes stop_codon:yes gene_type:complete
MKSGVSFIDQIKQKMSFGGPIDSMINSNKHNLRLLGKRKRLKEIQGEYKHASKAPMKVEPAHGDKLHLFHTKLRRENRSEKQRLILIIGLTLVLILILVYWVTTADYSNLIDLIN